MVSERSSSMADGTTIMMEKPATTGSPSSNKNQGNVPKKIHKAEREKLKRDHLNELFQELGRAIDPSRQNNAKASILGDATQVLRDLLAQVESLRKENTTLMCESHYVTVERDELRDEKTTLENEVEKLQNELRQRMHPSDHIWSSSNSSINNTQLSLPQPMSTTTPQQLEQLHHPFVLLPLNQDFQPYCEAIRPASQVRRPHARYPSTSDSWPAQLLSVLPRTSSEEGAHQEPQVLQLCTTSSSTITSGSREEGSVRSLAIDNDQNVS